MPRLLKTRNCPHCRAPLSRPVPRVCPACAGSLQQRYLAFGCLSSAPKLLVASLGLYEALRLLVEGAAGG